MNRFYPLILLLLCLLIYILLAGRLKFQFPTEPANYFSHLSLSFLNGRLDLVNPPWDHDLSLYRGKLYLYWGPTPTLLILPLIFIFGVNISDVLYTAIFASLSPFLAYLIFINMEKIGLLKKSIFRNIILALFLAFGTVYFSIAVRGGVWFTSQVFSTIYVLISLYLIFLFFHTRKIFFLILSSLFLGLGIWGRLTFFLYLPIFLALFFIFRIKLKQLALFCFVLALLFALSCFYNYFRFNSILENGFNYHNPASRYKANKEKYGYFNLKFVSHNFYYTFINPPEIIEHSPYFKFDAEGNSFLLLSPLFFLIFLMFRNNYWKVQKIKIFNSVVILSFILIVLFQLTFFGTGWFQFSTRYLLDIIPLLLLLLAQVIDDISKPITLLLLLVSIFFNTLGALWLIGVLHV